MNQKPIFHSPRYKRNIFLFAVNTTRKCYFFLQKKVIYLFPSEIAGERRKRLNVRICHLFRNKRFLLDALNKEYNTLIPLTGRKMIIILYLSWILGIFILLKKSCRGLHDLYIFFKRFEQNEDWLRSKTI